MKNNIKLKPSEHLVDLILNMNGGMPNYALFLGAGASWYSGIPTANEMVETWRRQLYERSKAEIDYKNWLVKNSWYNSEQEYGILFKELYDEAPQRRDYIENCMENAHPTWGYVYLANLLEAQIFNSVFTTNFDDLLNEACYLYSEKVRPIVCAHDSEVNNLRITSKRTKIIKLHGDFLFNDIKNTHEETTRLTKNMQMKLTEYSKEYGLVIIGYGGRDNSIMTILETLLKQDDYFKHGVYWCIRKGDTPRKRVAALFKKDRVHPIEITGFDEFMALLHNKANLILPATVTNPLKVAEQRSKIFCGIRESLRENEIIRHDIEKVLDGLGIGLELDDKEKVAQMPLELKAAIMIQNGNLPNALEYMKLAVKENKNDPSCAYQYADILTRLDNKDEEEIKKFVLNSSLYPGDKTYFLLFTHFNKLLIDTATSIINTDPGNLIARINRAIAYKRLNKKTLMNKDLSELEKRQPDEAISAGIASLRKNKREMFKLLDKALDKKLISVDGIQRFPVFDDYQQDVEFKEFIQHRQDNRIE